MTTGGGSARRRISPRLKEVSLGYPREWRRRATVAKRAYPRFRIDADRRETNIRFAASHCRLAPQGCAWSTGPPRRLPRRGILAAAWRLRAADAGFG